ncbi:MAG: mechanosensitive ion channel domain-containing protein, partial [Planctomycetota bacterium]
VLSEKKLGAILTFANTEIQKKIQFLEKETLLEPALKKKIVTFYQQSLLLCQQTQLFLTQILEFEKKILEAPKRLLQIREELKNPPSPLKTELLENLASEPLASRQSEIDATLSVLKKQFEQFNVELKRRATRQPELLQKISEARKSLETWEKERKDSALEEEKEIQLAQQSWESAKTIILETELSLYQHEIAYYESNEALLMAQQNKAIMDIAEAEKNLEVLRIILSKKKEIETFSSLKAETIEALSKQIEAKKEIDDKIKGEILEIYRKTLTSIKEIEIKTAEIVTLDQDRLEAPKLLEQIRSEKPQTFTKLELPAEISLQQLEQALTLAKNELSEAKLRLTNLEDEVKRRAEQRVKIPKDILEAKQKLETIQKQIQQSSDTSKGQDYYVAQKTYWSTQKKLSETQILASEKEILNYDARIELMPARREQAARNISYLEKQAKAYEEAVNDKRKIETERAIQEAKEALKKTANTHPVAQNLAKENELFAKKRANLNLKRISDEIAKTQKTLHDFTNNAKWVREKIKVAGLSESLGLVLRTEKEKFLDLNSHRKKNLVRETEITAIRIDLLEIQKKRDDLFPDIDAQKDHLLTQLEQLEPLINKEAKDAIATALDNLLKTQTENLDSLLKDYTNYYTSLIDLDTREKELIQQAENYAAFIDENILWVRSSSPFEVKDFSYSFFAIHWLLQEEAWSQTFSLLGAEIRSSFFLYGFFLLSTLFLLTLRSRLLQKLEQIGNEVGSLKENAIDSLNLTFKAFFLTALIAFVFPAILMFMAWRLKSLPQESGFGKALGAGLLTCAFYYWGLQTIQLFCLPKGLGISHFRWNAKRLKFIQREITWFTFLGLPLFFIVSIMEWQTNDDYRQSLGRSSFILSTILLAFLFFRLLRPSNFLMDDFLRKNKERWIYQFRYFWYFLILLTPLILAVIAFNGYYYTALQLEQRLHATIILFSGLWVAYATIIRWFSLARLQIVLNQFHLQKETNAPVPLSVNLSTVNIQTQRLAKTFLFFALLLGLWWIWREVFPALGILKSVLISYEEVDGIIVPYLTLADISLALVIFICTLVASRNISGFLEITLLQKIPFGAGNRYAIIALSQYSIMLIGIIFSCGSLGIRWATIQWLVAALGVGLGFGLQEIVANFISGLILFFEQPVRVGDIVTVGETSGTVTDIQIRATTIRDWDCKSLVVPNKKFITESFINWTLTDQTLRLVIPISVSYQSNMNKVDYLLRRIVHDHPKVLKNPEPVILLQEFGACALIFSVRVYLAHIDDMFPARNELTKKIIEEFRLHKIEIALPQQDLHIRSVQAPIPIHHSPSPQNPTNTLVLSPSSESTEVKPIPTHFDLYHIPEEAQKNGTTLEKQPFPEPIKTEPSDTKKGSTERAIPLPLLQEEPKKNTAPTVPLPHEKQERGQKRKSKHRKGS